MSDNNEKLTITNEPRTAPTNEELMAELTKLRRSAQLYRVRIHLSEIKQQQNQKNFQSELKILEEQNEKLSSENEVLKNEANKFKSLVKFVGEIKSFIEEEIERTHDVSKLEMSIKSFESVDWSKPVAVQIQGVKLQSIHSKINRAIAHCDNKKDNKIDNSSRSTSSHSLDNFQFNLAEEREKHQVGRLLRTMPQEIPEGPRDLSADDASWKWKFGETESEYSESEYSEYTESDDSSESESDFDVEEAEEVAYFLARMNWRRQA